MIPNNKELQVCLLSPEEQQLRLSRLAVDMPMLLSDSANLFWLTGRVFSGYVYLAPGQSPRYFVKRPSSLTGKYDLIRKPEEILPLLGGEAPTRLGLELGTTAYSTALRLKEAMGATELVDVSARLMQARSVKTPLEQQMMRADGVKHVEVYSHIPALFQEGMTDIELQVAIESLSRLHGCLGIFRIYGPDMELHMGNVLTGENADFPSPYDFAMGGSGMSPALPVGASGEEIRAGHPVMVDMNGCFNGYMTDMTRCYSYGELSDEVKKAHQCSVDICHALAAMGKPGVEARALYEKAEQMAAEAGLAENFMGHRYHAGFVGHGVGIQVNELPVISPRSRHVLEAGNTIAIEPKFVLPHIGAIGIENTYICQPDGLECITNAPEEITYLL